jgi:dTDP-4-amino-4,6-dideoxygalactose transaminase
MQHMLDRGVATRRGVMCAHREPAYAPADTGRIAGPLAVGERAQDECVVLPLYPQMTEADQEAVVAALREACAPPAQGERSHADKRDGRWPDAA